LNWTGQLRPAVSFIIKCDKCNTWSTQTTLVSAHRSEMGHTPNLHLNLKGLTMRANKLYSSCNFHTHHRLHDVPVQMKFH
jgi:hypothetical protein